MFICRVDKKLSRPFSYWVEVSGSLVATDAHHVLAQHMKDRWMIHAFTSISYVCQSYQDDGRVIMQGPVQ